MVKGGCFFLAFALAYRTPTCILLTPGPPTVVRLAPQAIDRSEKANMPSKRIHNIIEYMTYEIYLYVQRGLFERHKIIFALMLTNKVLTSAGKVKATDLDVFLKGGAALDINSVRKKPKDWIPDSVWLNIIALSAMDAFRDIPDSVFRNDGLWRQWYDQEAPEMAKVPDYEDRLNKFERMCVVKTFREDRTLIAAADYIAEALGQRFVESVPLNMEKAWQESHAKCPLICLLSPGADPTKLIEDLAKKKKIKTLGVSMGQGQEVIARKHMAAASLEGHWVLLQNTHLGLGYLTEVETFLVKVSGGKGVGERVIRRQALSMDTPGLTGAWARLVMGTRVWGSAAPVLP